LISSVDQLHRERQRQHNERRFVVGFDDKGIAPIKPSVQFTEAIGAGFALDPQYPAFTDRQFEVMAGSGRRCIKPSGKRAFAAGEIPFRRSTRSP
jgi:hypothetical protein